MQFKITVEPESLLGFLLAKPPRVRNKLLIELALLGLGSMKNRENSAVPITDLRRIDLPDTIQPNREKVHSVSVGTSHVIFGDELFEQT